MRISDWSSDVCSSDLRAIGAAAAIGADPLAHVVAGDLDHSALDIAQRCNAGRRYRFSFAETAPKGNPHEGNHPERRQRLAAAAADARYAQMPGRRRWTVDPRLAIAGAGRGGGDECGRDRKSTRLNTSQ